jgi:hypothetical protein
MINHKHKCIFVEVPKTGSTSIRSIIGYPKRPHLDIVEIESQITTEQFNEYFKFGFVRNPWDRAVSLFQRKHRLTRKHKKSFVDFIKWHNYATDTCIHPSQKKYQLDFFTDSVGELLVDFIGRFENLQEDFNIVCDKIGIPQQTLPYKNPSKHKHYTEYYDDETKQIVAKKYAKDIEYFGYKFGE